MFLSLFFFFSLPVTQTLFDSSKRFLFSLPPSLPSSNHLFSSTHRQYKPQAPSLYRWPIFDFVFVFRYGFQCLCLCFGMDFSVYVCVSVWFQAEFRVGFVFRAWVSIWVYVSRVGFGLSIYVSGWVVGFGLSVY